jgi:organic hydroperoxide reductase OsmC/OhrA
MEAPGTVTLSLISDYRLKVDFGLAGVPDLTTDAAPPLGRGQGPDSERLLMAAVGNCLTASLAFSLRKYKNAEVAMQATVDARLAPNEQGRLRMNSMSVVIRLGVPMASLRLAERALAQYEDFCVVTQSVRAAIPVDVKVFDSEGAPLTP